MRLRDATRSKVNLVLLRYVSDTNCKWLSKIGVSPANYHKMAATPNINLSTDQLVRMIDPRYLSNAILDLLRQLSAQMYSHHAIFRIHKNKIS